jgi:hypothetical protein
VVGQRGEATTSLINIEISIKTSTNPIPQEGQHVMPMALIDQRVTLGMEVGGADYMCCGVGEGSGSGSGGGGGRW